jgi:hypothetical protein
MNKTHKTRLDTLIEDMIYDRYPQTLDDDLADLQADGGNRVEAIQEIISYLEGELE